MSNLVCQRVARALSDRPIFMLPAALRAALDGIAPRLGISASAPSDEDETFAGRKRAAVIERLSMIVEAEHVDVCDGLGDYGLTVDGIAVIPIVGTLIDRYDWLAALCGFTSYDTIKITVQAALEDSRVNAILLDIDSPGGEAAGMLDCADVIRAATATKPVWASANSLAASAGFGLAAAAARVTLPRLGMVGSVGVVGVHIDQSAQDKEFGLKYTAIYSGKHKIDGWAHAPLAPDVREALQARFDESRRKFAEAVGHWRGMSTDDVLSTEANTYDDSAAVEIGFADDVLSFDETLAELAAAASNSSAAPPLWRGAISGKESNMTTTGKTTTAKPKAEEKPAEQLAQDTVDEGTGAEPAPVVEDPPAGGKAPVKEPETAAKADPAEVAAYCAANGAANMAADLIRSGATMDAVKGKVDSAGSIRKRVADAQKLSPGKIGTTLADEMISQGLTPDQAGAKLLELVAAGQSDEIRTTHAPGGPGGGGTNADATSWAGVFAEQTAKAARGILPPDSK